jgi:hypothetical protein
MVAADGRRASGPDAAPQAVVAILSMKTGLCCAATKKNPERLKAPGLGESCLNSVFLDWAVGGFGVSGEAGAAQLGLVACRLQCALAGLQLDPTPSRRAWQDVVNCNGSSGFHSTWHFRYSRSENVFGQREALDPVRRSLKHSTCLLSPARCEGD